MALLAFQPGSYNDLLTVERNLMRAIAAATRCCNLPRTTSFTKILAGDCSNDKFCVTDDDDEVCINLNVSAYDSNKLTVAVQGRRLSVEYSDGTDKNGITGRRFMHIFDMSKSVLLETVECLLLDTGILHIRMKKAKIQLNRKEIPIQKAATFMIFK